MKVVLYVQICCAVRMGADEDSVKQLYSTSELIDTNMHLCTGLSMTMNESTNNTYPQVKSVLIYIILKRF